MLYAMFSVLRSIFPMCYLARSTCFYACSHVYLSFLQALCFRPCFPMLCLCARLIHVDMYISMPTCLDLCFHMLECLDLYLLHALYYLPCACALHAMFVCLDLGYVCHAMCYCSPFVAFVSHSCVLAIW